MRPDQSHGRSASPFASSFGGRMFRSLGKAARLLGYAEPDCPFSSRVRAIELPEIQSIDCKTFSEGPGFNTELLAPALARMRRELPSAWAELTQTDFTYVLASTLAHNLKPYGPGCASQQFDELLRAPFLDCSNYGLLTHYISLLLVDEVDRRPISFVGWDGGAIGNHQMLFIDGKGKANLVLDPTTGFVCIASFDEVGSGKPIASDAIAIVGAKPELRNSRETYLRALLEGQFRPSDLLYYFHNAEDLLHRYGNPFDWPTPAVGLLRQRYRGDA
jgi:hypothetical protein